MYNVENPFFIIEFNSLFNLSSTTFGSTSPYSLFALPMHISSIVFSAPSIWGGHFSFDIGLITSHMSAILFVFVTTTSKAFSLPKYSNSSSISSVVLKYNGAWLSQSSKPCPAIKILLYISSVGSKKCTSPVATTGLPSFSPSFTICLFISCNSSLLPMLPSLNINSLLPIGCISK